MDAAGTHLRVQTNNTMLKPIKHSSLTCILCSIHQLFTCSDKENGINHSLEFKYTTALHIQPITELVLPQLYKLGLVVYLQKFAAYTALPLIAL